MNQNLATVNIGNVPTGTYGEYELVQHGGAQLVARSTYREGWSMVLYLVDHGEGCRVSSYDRFEE